MESCVFSFLISSCLVSFVSQALLSLCSDESVSAKGALDLIVGQMKNVLGSLQLPLHASMETLGRAYHATEIFVQVWLSGNATVT